MSVSTQRAAKGQVVCAGGKVWSAGRQEERLCKRGVVKSDIGDASDKTPVGLVEPFRRFERQPSHQKAVIHTPRITALCDSHYGIHDLLCDTLAPSKGEIWVQAVKELETPSAKAKAKTPTVRQTLFGGILQDLRERSGLSFQHVADELGVSHQTVRRMENAEVAFKLPYVAALLRLYQLNEKDLAAYLADAKAANEPEWWESEYKDVVPPYLTRLLSLEETAETIRGYAPQLVPDLLRTQEYARAALRTHEPPMAPDTVERLVDLQRLRQQRFLSGEGRHSLVEDPADTQPQLLHLILDETALRRAITDRKSMNRQLQYLIDLAEESSAQKVTSAHIRLRILRHSAGAAIGMGEAIYLYRFRLHNLPDSVVRLHLGGGEYMEKDAQVTSRYLEALDRANGRATGFRDAPDALREIQRELWA
ncbi:helix-turn-helix domain-containing protein [Streptomyces lydicus]|uniref:helix-turn-helix domain-containing protein n=1 Tax=Streptomyces lydicus TaxID=47763 RepID=UPI0037AC1F2C